MQQKFQTICRQLSSSFLERDEIIQGTMAALLAGEHVLFLGPPGTAKSQLARAVAESVDQACYFEWLLTRFSTPEEIFGPFSLKSLQQDRFERVVHGKLPEAHVAFLDEIFKASSAILNSLLTVINERLFHNNGATLRVPLISIIGASNELPQAEDVNALYDRFLLRFWVGYVSEGSFRNLLNLNGNGTKAMVSLQELEKARTTVAKVTVSETTLDAVEKLRCELLAAGIQLSDRKWRQALGLIKAVSWLNGQPETCPENLEIMKHAAWSDVDERNKVARIVASVSNPLGAALLDAEDNALEIYNNALTAGTAEAGAEANQKLKAIQKQLDVLAGKNPAQRLKINALKCKVQEQNRRIIKETLGLEV